MDRTVTREKMRFIHRKTHINRHFKPVTDFMISYWSHKLQYWLIRNTRTVVDNSNKVLGTVAIFIPNLRHAGATTCFAKMASRKLQLFGQYGNPDHLKVLITLNVTHAEGKRVEIHYRELSQYSGVCTSQDFVCTNRECLLTRNMV